MYVHAYTHTHIHTYIHTGGTSVFKVKSIAFSPRPPLVCVCMRGVWCVVCGVWCVVCGERERDNASVLAVWCVVCDVWCVVPGV